MAKITFNADTVRREDSDMGLLEGKQAVIFGVANRRSIAWGIARALSREGATLALTYESERVEKMVRDCADQIPGTQMNLADVTREDQVEAVFAGLGEQWGKVDIVVHSVAWAPREALEGSFLDTSAEAFSRALEVSAYSLIPISRHALPLMRNGGSI